MKQMTTEQITERAEQAKRLLNNTDFIDIVGLVKADIFDNFCATNVLDTERREELHKVSYAIELMKKKIETYISIEKLQKQ
ncbi:hypothetical protein [Agrobacterium tumefaciens]|uniref:Uncharacterized protein n=1 Tax=Agrobacterium tumefaciens TaxID=358 RepID=A0AA44JAD0_AGRTU|nr:hypothetical protein [Agrobacterium tumefaciens]NTB86852.1 hypothetical protein [Agrobacterium tumefaciens]NTC21181.1 hypothetical protein [Agrobacterium tumefaciens]NTC30729.1 hypothetical protein [Agrobacterium tumefaciens]